MEELICKCGGELAWRIVGDESVLRCADCGYFAFDVEDWMKPWNSFKRLTNGWKKPKEPEP